MIKLRSISYAYIFTSARHGALHHAVMDTLVPEFILVGLDTRRYKPSMTMS
jgi:hypothetical protein